MSDAESVQVLVADDDPGVRALCRWLLEQQGYGVQEAANGREALERVAQEPPHVIVMDVSMPNMDGLECARLLKSDPLTRDIPLIMASAHSQDTDVIAGLESGADEYLAKPIRPKEFTLRVRSMARLQLGRIELTRSNEVRGEQTRVLTLLLDFSRSLVIARTLDTILEDTLSVTGAVMSSRRVSIMLPDNCQRHLTITRSIGIDPGVAASVCVPIGGAIAGQVYQSRQPIVINTEQEARSDNRRYDSAIFASVPMICTTLATPEGVVGVLNITDRWFPGPFSPMELESLDLISSMAASAIHDQMSRQARDEARDSIVLALASLAEHRDVETGKHLDRVTQFALMLAEELRSNDDHGAVIDDEFLRDLQHAVPLHDIGKVAIPDRILLKPGPLTATEMAIMQTHAEIGAATIRSVIEKTRGVRFLKMAEQVACAHHERYDGTGYPHGLKGTEIPLCGRIVGLADVYDALTTKRVYKAAHGHADAVATVAGGSGTQFDPAVVAAFLRRERDFARLARQLADQPAPSDNARTLDMPTLVNATPDLVTPQRG